MNRLSLSLVTLDTFRAIVKYSDGIETLLNVYDYNISIDPSNTILSTTNQLHRIEVVSAPVPSCSSINVSIAMRCTPRT